MTPSEFKRTLSASAPPATGMPALDALWWVAKGDWACAHRIVQDECGQHAAWVHAYLHRAEGDLSNAAYWYQRAGQSTASGPLEDEWDAIATILLRTAA